MDAMKDIEEDQAKSGAPLLAYDADPSPGGDVELEQVERRDSAFPNPETGKRSFDLHQDKQDYSEDDTGSDSDFASSVSSSRAFNARTWRPPKTRRQRQRRNSLDLYTAQEECAVRRKLDIRLVGFVAILYALSFLDRSNIGNAAIAGLRTDLSLSNNQYTWLLRSFYLTYIAFEWMTLLYRLVPAHIYISLCVAAWGLVASFQALTVNFSGLLLCRLLLGVAEAAFGPGIPFYMSFFYKRTELAYRVGLFISAAPLASCFASSLAWAIVRFGDGTGVASWRLLFLVEGFPSVLIAVLAWWWVPDGPGSAPWLTGRERRVAMLRLERGESAKVEPVSNANSRSGGKKRRLEWKEIARTLKDPKSYLTAGMFFSCNVAFSSMPVFEPTIVKAMGYNTTTAQALSAMPHLSAFFIVLVTSHLSDRHGRRAPFIILVSISSMFGYILLALAPALSFPTWLKYLCLFPITAGFFSAVTLTIVWTLDNQESDSSKGAGVALLNVIGQMGPLVGTGLYPDTDRPGFVKGHAICALFMGAVAGLAWALTRVLRHKNDAPADYEEVATGEMEMKAVGGEWREDVEDMSDRRERNEIPQRRFVYIL